MFVDRFQLLRNVGQFDNVATGPQLSFGMNRAGFAGGHIV